MYKNHSYNNREELNQCNKLNRDNTEKFSWEKETKYLYPYIYRYN